MIPADLSASDAEAAAEEAMKAEGKKDQDTKETHILP